MSDPIDLVPATANAHKMLEIAIILDVTQSMQVWVTTVKESINQIVKDVSNEFRQIVGGDLKVRLSFIGYRDVSDRRRFSILDFTEDI